MVVLLVLDSGRAQKTKNPPVARRVEVYKDMDASQSAHTGPRATFVALSTTSKMYEGPFSVRCS